MPARRRYVFMTAILLVGAAAGAAAAVLLLPDRWIRWIPAVVGAAWTGALVWLARRLGREPGAPGPESLRGGIVASGLLTALAASWAVRDTVAWPELLLLASALVAFGFWVRALAREAKRLRRFPPAPPGPVLDLRDRPAPPDWAHQPRRRTRWH